MKTFLALVVVAAGLVLLGVAATWEAPVALVFGWVAFLARTLPKVTVDWPSVSIGVGAAALLAVGVQWLGSRWRPWKVRWSLASVAAVVLMFAAGLSMIALVHQTVWLLRDGRLHRVEVRPDSGWRSPEFSLRFQGIAFSNYTGAPRVFPSISEE